MTSPVTIECIRCRAHDAAIGKAGHWEKGQSRILHQALRRALPGIAKERADAMMRSAREARAQHGPWTVLTFATSAGPGLELTYNLPARGYQWRWLNAATDAVTVPAGDTGEETPCQ